MLFYANMFLFFTGENSVTMLYLLHKVCYLETVRDTGELDKAIANAEREREYAHQRERSDASDAQSYNDLPTDAKQDKLLLINWTEIHGKVQHESGSQLQNASH